MRQYENLSLEVGGTSAQNWGNFSPNLTANLGG